MPIGRLNEVIRAVAPQLVCVSRGATLDDDSPWLYAHEEFPRHVVLQLIRSWIRDLHTPRARAENPELVAAAIELDESLKIDELRWKSLTVDLFERSVNDSETAEPASRLYRLLPDLLAERVTAQEPYRFEGVEVSPFRICATARGAELVSWPPQSYNDPNGNWRYSLLINLSVQTMPFNDDFRVHVRTGVRRWCANGEVTMRYRGAVSAYLLPDSPWLKDAPTSSRLCVGRIVKNRTTRTHEWARGGPQGMLNQLLFARDFPDPDVLQSNPETWIDSSSGIQAGVVHSTSMGGHGVGAGLMPRDRSPLTDWVAEALQPELLRVPDHHRSKYPVVPRNLPKSPPEKLSVEEKQAFKTVQRSHRAARLRELLAEQLDGDPLIVEIRWQNDRTRLALVSKLTELLDLDGNGGEGTELRWESPELQVRVILDEAGEMAAALEFPGPKPKAQELGAAISTRRSAVRSLCHNASGSQMTVVEIGGAKSFVPLTDPKFAIRLGCADAGRLTKFIQRPTSANRTATTTSIINRAEQTWTDVFRQLGVRTLPLHSLSGFPADLEYVGLWMVKRRADGPTHKRRTAPVAVRMSSDGRITGFDPASGEWISYRQLQLELARGAELPGAFEQEADSEESQAWVPDLAGQRAETDRFVKAMLYSLRDRPVLLLTHAQNTRNYWQWLTNGNLAKGLLQLGANPPQQSALYGQALGHVRVRDSGADETSQWFAPDDTTFEHGIASGLWLHPQRTKDTRTYFSTAEKPETAKNAAVTASKLAPRVNLKSKQVIDTAANAWNPGLLEITIATVPESGPRDPEAWAALTHQLRRAPDYRSTLALPLPLHLAKKLTQYLLPHDEDDLDEDTIDQAAADSEEAEADSTI